MVKLTGPCFSIKASGTLNDTLTFGKTKGVAYAKRHFKPANPQTPAQIGVRCLPKFLMQTWKDLSQDQQNSFSDLADQWNLTLYHAFLRLNTQRWAKNDLPIVDIQNTDTPEYDNFYMTAFLYGTLYKITITVMNPNVQPFAAQIFMSKLWGYTPSKNNTVIFLSNWKQISGGYRLIHQQQGISWPPPIVNTRYFLTSGNASPIIMVED